MPQIARRKSKERRALEDALNRAAEGFRAMRAGDVLARERTEDALRDVSELRERPFGEAAFESACRFVQEQRFLFERPDEFVAEVSERLGDPKW